MKPLLVALLHVVLSLYVSQAAAQWVQTGLSSRGIKEIAVGSRDMFVVTSDSGTVFQSIDGGVTWGMIVASTAKHVAVGANRTVFMVRGPLNEQMDLLYRSTDAGVSWENLHVADRITPPHAFWWEGVLDVEVSPTGAVSSGLIAKGGFGNTNHHVIISTDNGSAWTLATGGYGGGDLAFWRHCVITTSASIFWPIGVWFHYVSFSPDGGQSWRRVEGVSPISFSSNGNILYCIPDGSTVPPPGLVLSEDSLTTYSRISTVHPSALLALPHGVMLVGTDTAGIYRFTDNGDSLRTVNEGLTDLHIHTLALDGSGYAYVGTDAGIWRRQVSQLVSVSETPQIPQTLWFEQNYPNPFNPSTTIRYGLPARSSVTLTVFNTLGQQVATLVEAEKEAGYHEVRFDASMFSSGLYFYRLNAGDYSETKRMLFLK